MPSRRKASRRPRPAARSRTSRTGRALRVPIRGPVRVVFLDVDGTLTDGMIGFDDRGDSRSFSIRDGLAMTWAREHGVTVVAISGRSSDAVQLRMKDLGIECHAGVQDKIPVAERVRLRVGASWAQCAMVGDDLPDVALMKRVGWAVAVADAQPEVHAVAHVSTRSGGGRGAVREVMEAVLRHNGAWEHVLEHYEVGPRRAGATRSRA